MRISDWSSDVCSSDLWRTQLRRDMVDLDTTAFAHAVDSLLNFETVKYFNAEEREQARFSKAVRTYANAAVKSENSLAYLNIGQALITNLMMAGAMGYTIWGWSRGLFTTGDVVLVNTLLSQLFRPLDMLGMVYRNIRQGLIDMEAMFALIDTPADIVDAPDAPLLQIEAGRFASKMCISVTLQIGKSFTVSTSTFRRGRRLPSWGRLAQASQLSRACSSASMMCNPGAF